MSDSGFVHLHTHTEYSLLDGAGRIKDLLRTAKEQGMSSLAITDHGVMYGVVDFYKTALKEGIKPILGCEVYVAPRTLADKSAQYDDSPYHLVLLAENETGYRNLLQLVSLGFTEGFYYKPRVDKDVLREYSSGLIALSACLAGEVAQLILKQQPEQAKAAALTYQDIFGVDNFYLELQDHGFGEQKTVNRGLIEISRETGIPLVATNDIHYVQKSDAEVQDVLLCIQTGKTVDDVGRLKFDTEEFYLKTVDEMRMLFGEYPQALSNTAKIAERCNVSMDFNQMYMPDYVVPAGETLDSYLGNMCWQKLPERYGQAPSEEVKDRLRYELDVIKKMGYSGYFLIVWDFINFARENKIPVGPGRGSAAGSIVAYVLKITNIDPLKYDLLFERFLNPERVSMPDIDVDICYEQREKVIDYVIQRYGIDRVSQIITFGTMAAKAAVRDVGRALNMPYGEVDRVAKMIPTELGMTIAKALTTNQDLKELYAQETKIKKLMDMAAALEGMPRHASTHAAGVVIAREPLTHYLPLYRTSDGVVTTQFPMGTVEEIGLLKMDLLGLRTLTVIGDTLKIIKHTIGQEVDIDQIPVDDQNTFAMLCRGEGIGVFQLESSGMRNILRELKPEIFDDIIALVALYRPGPLGSGMVDDFIKNKHGRTTVKYLHPKLVPILQDTYGVILYQEQVMRISNELAGFSLGEADLLRRAMGKKKPEIIAGLRNQFVQGAVKNGIDVDIAGQIFDLMEYFAGYGFNKSHSAAYALVAYQTAYLKANYPLPYMAALLTSIMGSSDKVALYIEQCQIMGIDVLPPDVNESFRNFTVVGQKIRFGLAAIKNVGHNAIDSIIVSREKEGIFTSLPDFCTKVDLRVVNKRVIESLIKGGALDSLPGYRAQKIVALDTCLEIAQKRQKDKESGQISLFDLGIDNNDILVTEVQLPDMVEYPSKELLMMEKEMLGLYITGHPLGEYKDALREKTSVNLLEARELADETKVIIGGIIASSKRITTRRGEPMLFANFEDLTGMIEVIIFPRIYQQYARLLTNDALLLVKGRVTVSDEDTKVIAEEIRPLDSDALKQLFIKIDVHTPLVLEQLQKVLQSHPGQMPVNLCYMDPRRKEMAPREWWVAPQPTLVEQLEQLLGPNTTVVK